MLTGSHQPSTSAPSVAAQPVRDPGASLLASRRVGGAGLEAWISSSACDMAWDEFLQSTPLGQFQQSSIWGEVKGSEGWGTVRVVIWDGDQIIAGFQILTRSRGGILREGFLNKGPVCPSEDPMLHEWLVDLVKAAARKGGIDLLLVQSPDLDSAMDPVEAARGFEANGLTKVITSTLCVPLGNGLAPAQDRMNKTTLKHVRQSGRRGAVVREGDGSGMPHFFRLMGITCQRQNTAPNPPTEAAACTLWEAFHRRGLARLTFADCEGSAVAGLLTLRFGKRVTAWKKGWNEEHGDRHPNTLLSHESILWAEAAGAELYDFVGVGRSFAQALIQQGGVDAGIQASRYFFMLGFGAEPRLLPLARVWLRNPLLRTGYRMALPVLRKRGRVET